MCGIVGTFALQSGIEVQPDRLARMRDAMVHRGPDGAGLWLSADRRIGLGHRRLSIVDLSVAADQPLPNEDRSTWVTFNGEIYNHLDLRKQLLSAGHRFATDHSDTEVLVHGYEEWGIDGLLSRIDGDYAFGIWDGNRKALYLARDRVGVKPLYYATSRGVLHFASEIKAILECGDVARRVNFRAMRHYFAFLTTPAPWTMFDGVYKLPAGHYLRATSSEGLRVTRYWDALPGQSGLHARGAASRSTEREFVDEVRSRLAQAVEKRVMSDVPIGVMLSGGVDSTTNVALMSRVMSQPVNTFTVGFRDYPSLNETDQAREISRHFGTTHHEVLINRTDMEGYIGRLIHSQDEPLADWVCIPLHFVSELARHSGVRVVQVGEGSDEQFVGYSHYQRYFQLQKYFWSWYTRAPRTLRRSVAGLADLAAKFHPGLDRHAEFLDRGARQGELFWSGSVVYWDRIKQRLFGAGADAVMRESGDESSLAGISPPPFETADFVAGVYQQFDAAGSHSDVLARMIYAEFKLRLPELLLMRVDKISMSSSIESRVPFLDHRLVELTMDLPDSLRLGRLGLKSILKQAIGDVVPAEVLARKKRGFDAPMSQWLREEFGHQVESRLLSCRLLVDGVFERAFVRKLFVDHRRGVDRAIYIWLLFNFVEWYEYWIEGQRS
ncbi:MAG: asparagine synthase (glutamine-hydrolyzing) [Steroidobacteraceae bacterium]